MREIKKTYEKMYILFIYSEKCVLEKRGAKYFLPSFVSLDTPAYIFIENTAYAKLGCIEKPLLIPSVRFIQCMKKYSDDNKEEIGFNLSFCAIIFDYDIATTKNNNLFLINLDDIKKFPRNFDGLANIFVNAYLEEIESDGFREYNKNIF